MHLLEFYTVGRLRKSKFEALAKCDFESPIFWGTQKENQEM